MNDNTVLATFLEIFAEVGDIDPSVVSLDSRLAPDLDIDSLLLVEITVVAGERLGVEIPDEQLANFATVRDLVRFVTGEVVAA